MSKMIQTKNAEEIIGALKEFPEHEIGVDLTLYPLDVELFNRINHSVLQKYRLVPLFVNEDFLFLAKHQIKPEIKPVIQLETGFKPILISASEDEIERILRFYLSSENLDSYHQQKMDDELARNGYDEKTAVSKVDSILKKAIKLKASDIHIFPHTSHYKIVFRIDGVLHPMQSVGLDAAKSLIARIKIIANLNITEKQLPQDGNISMPSKKGRIDFRVSLIPTVEGDSLSIRVLDAIENIKQLEEIGFAPDATEKIRGMLTDSGIILVTGQTGSGKSTTIYALINELMKENLNIITIEDPVEYKLPGIRQIQIQEPIGYDFAYALRAILRHDPDVIVVGEIRDQKTAQIAIQSALTGHLVISTLHTKSAIGSVTRLLEIGIADYLLASVLKGVISQKLVRKICGHCHNEGNKGCIHCNHTGYLGRCPIYEILPITEKIATSIAKGANEEELLRQARKNDFITIEEYANSLILNKVSDAKEIQKRLYSSD